MKGAQASSHQASQPVQTQPKTLASRVKSPIAPELQGTVPTAKYISPPRPGLHVPSLTHETLNIPKNKFMALEARLSSPAQIQQQNNENVAPQHAQPGLGLVSPTRSRFEASMSLHSSNQKHGGPAGHPPQMAANTTFQPYTAQEKPQLAAAPTLAHTQTPAHPVSASEKRALQITPGAKGEGAPQNSGTTQNGVTPKRRKRSAKQTELQQAAAPGMAQQLPSSNVPQPHKVDHEPHQSHPSEVHQLHLHQNVHRTTPIQEILNVQNEQNNSKSPQPDTPPGNSAGKEIMQTHGSHSVSKRDAAIRSRKITDYWNGTGKEEVVSLMSPHIHMMQYGAPMGSPQLTKQHSSGPYHMSPHGVHFAANQSASTSGNPTQIVAPIPTATVEIQTDLRSSTLDTIMKQNSEIDELRSNLEEQRILVLRQRELILKHDLERKRMLEILKVALVEQARTERRQARDKVGRDRMRLGYLTRSTGFGAHASSELWTNGTWLDQLEHRRMLIQDEKEDIERSRKLLSKRKPNRQQTNKELKAAAARAEAAANQPDLGQNGSNSDDSKDATFARPKDPTGPLLPQEHYEQDEVLKIRMAANKREENEYQGEMERFERERSLHIRELKRISNEDNSKYNTFQTLTDRYILLNLLGKGGFSEVYRAFDMQQQIYVAVKIHHLNKDWSDQKKLDYSRHANRECEIQMRIDHPRIVKLFDTFEIDMNTFCTVMEFCQGRDLDHYLKEHKTISEKEARSTMMQIVNALKYLNQMEKPVIHYDLKPGNILLCADSLGNIKITDFGLSKQLDSHHHPNDGIDLTSQGAGTYWYLPPECFVRGIDGKPPRIDNKVDVWAVGVIFYQCLYGKKPFGHNMSQEAILKSNTILRATDVSFAPKPPVSDTCKDFIRACLAYQKEDRADVFQLAQHVYLQPQARKTGGVRSRARPSDSAAQAAAAAAAAQNAAKTSMPAPEHHNRNDQLPTPPPGTAMHD